MTFTENSVLTNPAPLFALGQAMGRSTRPSVPAGQLLRMSWKLFSFEVVELLWRPLRRPWSERGCECRRRAFAASQWKPPGRRAVDPVTK